MNIPFYLSGNFGEIRSDHFHSGIDIKTNGSTGIPVYAISDGYISRIKVQANGYGKSIYITHDNGYTSVYGHLSNYREDMAKFVKDYQYRKRSFGVDIFPQKDKFIIKQGDLIAYSGNTGSTSGPHLHFEIRKSEGQIPVNVLKFNFPVDDHTDPVFFKLFIYPLGSDSEVEGKNEKAIFEVNKVNGKYFTTGKIVPEVFGNIGIGTEVFDYLNGTNNRCGVYILEMYENDQLLYKHVIDDISFSETRYINAHIDYEERVKNGTKVHKLFRLPNDRLGIYKKIVNEGVLNISDSSIHEIRIVAKDVAGNESSLTFNIKGTGHLSGMTIEQKYPEQLIMSYKSENTYSDQGMKLDIPAYALYEDLAFVYSRLPAKNELASDIFCIHRPEVPLQKPFILSIQPDSSKLKYRNSMIIVGLDKDFNISSYGGDYSDGFVNASISSFGNYGVAIDTVSPIIKPASGNGSDDLSNKKAIYFTITDELSGIGRYEGYIDNNWVLFEYDLKNDLLFYTFDESRLNKGMQHELELYVADNKDNVSLYHKIFTW